MRRMVVLWMGLATAAMGQRAIPSPEPCDSTCSRTVDEGHIIDLTPPAHVEVFGRDGLRLFDAIINSPQGRSIGGIRGAAIDSDETVAIGAVWDAERRYAGGVMLLDASGKLLRVIETGRYMPQVMTFDSNHDLWVYGWQRDAADYMMVDRTDYPLLRKFSKEGREEARLVGSKSFPGWVGGVEFMAAAGDRLGLLATAPAAHGDAQWIEIDFKGKILGNWPVGDAIWKLAFTPAGRLYTTDRDKLQTHLKVFDRPSGKWQRVAELDGDPRHEISYNGILGTDGEQLVFSSRNDKLVWLAVQ